MKQQKGVVPPPKGVPTSEKQGKFFQRQIPVLLIVPLLLLLFIVLHFRKEDLQPEANVKPQQTQDNSGHTIYRRGEFTLTRPLLLLESKTESAELLSLKRNINFLITKNINEKKINEAAVYLNRLSKDQWFSINPEKEFKPSSLLKLPYLMIYLKASEKDPAVLEQKYSLKEKNQLVRNQTFEGKMIEFGKSYTVRELLTYMIVHSDNNATLLLDQHLDYDALQKLFVDIGMAKPDLDDNYKLTAFEYSKFFHILFGATYLNRHNSEYALSLLTKCEFNKGMVAGLPAGTLIAHKFGEGGFLNVPGQLELHESAIIYLANEPILVTIFTRGNDLNELPGIISQITAEIVAGIKELGKASGS